MQQHLDVVAALRAPVAYVHEGLAPEDVEVVETHVSHLFFTGPFVYKVKKPVDLGFLDFTSLEARRHFCEEELRLNREYSPDVYVAVLPVTRSEDGIALSGPGEVIDYAVKMRQLPRDQMLDARLRRGDVSSEDVRRIAHRLAAIHERASRIRDVAGPGGWGAFDHHVEENIRQTESAAPLVGSETLEDIAAYSRAFLAARRDLFEQRQREGRVVDGHGDLHAGQVCLLDGIEFIDRLEFDAAYRCGDVAADLAFLAMDLDRFGRRDLSAALVDAYVAASGDEGLRALLPFFKCYRAHVRAKVALLKLDAPGLSPEERQASEQDVKAYFRLARSYALDALPKPALYVVMGLPGTGKSTLARGIARRWGLDVHSSDVERKRLVGLEPRERAEAAIGEGIYRPSIGRRTYRRLLDLAAVELRSGRSVVLDATFGDASRRREAMDVALTNAAHLWFIECYLPREEVERRMAARRAAGGDPSDAGIAVYDAHRRAWHTVEDEWAARHIRVDTGAAPEEAVRRVVSELFRRSV